MPAPVFARPKEDVSFDPNRFAPKPLFESPEMKVILASFRAGQFIPVHRPDVHVVLYILSGEGEVVAGERRRHVKEGDLAVVPRKVARGVVYLRSAPRGGSGAAVRSRSRVRSCSRLICGRSSVCQLWRAGAWKAFALGPSTRTGDGGVVRSRSGLVRTTGRAGWE